MARTTIRIVPALLALAACGGPPGTPVVELGPEGATSADDLVLTITDHIEVKPKDEVAYDVAWFRDGEEIEALADETTVPASQVSRGQEWRAVVTPIDRKARIGFAAEAALTIGNATPVIGGVSLSPTSPTRGDTLVATVTGADDADQDVLEFTYEWTANGVVIRSETLSGLEASLPGDPYMGRGDEITVTVTASDGIEDGESVTSETVTVANAPPTFSSLLITPDPLYTNTPAVWTVEVLDLDGDDYTWSAAWSVNGTEVGTSPTLAPTFFSRGDTVTLTATANDGEDTYTGSVEAIVANRPPGAAVISITPGAPRVEDDLVCTIDTPAPDADGDPLSYSITWYVDGSEWLGATADTTWAHDTIPAANTTEEQEWVCFAAATDGIDFGVDAESDSVVVNDGPGVGDESTVGVISGDPWRVCRRESASAWLAASTSGTYNAVEACQSMGYRTVDAQGGTWGTVCGYNGVLGREYYDGGGGSITSMRYTVHWRCVP